MDHPSARWWSDDEPTLAELLSTALRYEGWQVDHALSGHAAVRAAKTLDPDVIVLDVMLPDLSGIDVLRRVRATHTARPRPVPHREGRRGGPDRRPDRRRRRLLTKPFSLEEVVARLRALLRRDRRGVVARGGRARRRRPAHGRGQPRGVPRRRRHPPDRDRVRAAPLLHAQPQRVLSKAQILDRVWQYDFGGQANIVEL